MAAGRETMQQQQRWRIGPASLPIENLQPVDVGGAITDCAHKGLLPGLSGIPAAMPLLELGHGVQRLPSLSQEDLTERRMIVGTATERPEKPTVGPLNWQVVDGVRKK